MLQGLFGGFERVECKSSICFQIMQEIAVFFYKMIYVPFNFFVFRGK
jgi:hypothetical protein